MPYKDQFETQQAYAERMNASALAWSKVWGAPIAIVSGLFMVRNLDRPVEEVGPRVAGPGESIAYDAERQVVGLSREVWASPPNRTEIYYWDWSLREKERSLGVSTTVGDAPSDENSLTIVNSGEVTSSELEFASSAADAKANSGSTVLVLHGRIDFNAADLHALQRAISTDSDGGRKIARIPFRVTGMDFRNICSGEVLKAIEVPPGK